MRKTPLAPAFAALGLAVLVSGCAADSHSEDQRNPASLSDGSATATDDVQYVPLGDEHLAEGLEMTDCVAAQTDIRVPPDYLIEDEAHLEAMCPESTAIGLVADGSQQLVIGPDGVEFMDVSVEDSRQDQVHHLRCQDEEALVEKAEHNAGDQAAGWPQDWDGEGQIPDPYCHPDYLEIGEWEHLQAHYACCEGVETSTFVRAGQSQDEINKFLWEQSQARAGWAP